MEGTHSDTSHDTSDVGPDPATVSFTLKLGRALHRYGVPAYRLEEMMTLVFERLGGTGSFFSTPTGIFATFGPPEDQRTSLVRVEPGEVDLEKMSLLDELATEVLHGAVSPADGAARVDAIVDAPARYGPGLTAVCMGLASASTARVLGGGVNELAAVFFVGVVIGALGALPVTRRARLFEFLAALAASSLSVALALVLAPLSVSITVLAGLIVLLPGLTIVTAVRELATRNLVSGTARLTGAFVVFLELAFGVALGGQVYRLLPPVPFNAVPAPLPGWTEWVAVLLGTLALTVLFRARPRDAVWAVAGGVVALAGSRAGAYLLGPEHGAVLGALALGGASNLFARIANRPAFVPQLPGLIMLVPGSIGFVSLNRLLERDVVNGVDAAFKMLLAAVALVTGLLLANVLVPPRRAL